MSLPIIDEELHVARFLEDKKLRCKLSAHQTKPQLKDEPFAVSQREEGNASFRVGEFGRAVRQYGECVFSAASSDTLSCGLANRSAALFHLQQYEDSLRDMDSALEAAYPAARHHKLHVRRARCHLALGRPDRAMAALAQYTEALSRLTLSSAAREKLEREAGILKTDVERVRATPPHPEQPAYSKPTVASASPDLESGCSGIELRQTVAKGRHIVASRSVSKGDLLFAEEPYAIVLLPERRLDHCHHCITQTHALLPCERCRDVGYCSAACRSAAGANYHEAECGHAAYLESFGIGRVAVRLVLVAGLSRLEQLRQQLQPSPRGRAGDEEPAPAPDGTGSHQPSSAPDRTGSHRPASLAPDGTGSRQSSSAPDGTGSRQPSSAPDRTGIAAPVADSCDITRCDCYRPTGDRYLAVFHLMCHLPDSGGPDAYHYSRAAATLAIFLAEQTQFLDDGPSEVCLRWTAALLLRHILQLVCNAHALTKLVPLPTAGRVVQLREQRVASAIYPSASYMNHACDPSNINSFWGRTLLVRAVKHLHKGDEVFHCYGPHYARASSEQRRSMLLEQYQFLCDCQHCTVPRLRRHLEALDSPRCLTCGDVTLGDAAADDKWRTCRGCGASADYADRLARLRQIELQVDTVETLEEAKLSLSQVDRMLEQAATLASPGHRCLASLDDLRAQLCTELGHHGWALASVRRSAACAEARYGGDSVEVANLLLTAADLLTIRCRHAGLERRRELSEELRKTCHRAESIFSIHYGPWSAACRELRQKRQELPRPSSQLPLQ